MNMFFGAHPQAQTPTAPEASSSKSAEASSSSAKQGSRAEQEERDLAEAIRLSLAEASSSSDKGKTPAPAPVVDVASSTAEVLAVDTSFNTLTADFVFPEELDFSTSRAASPARDGSEPSSAISRLSYSARNHNVRVQHQALSALLARLDAVESFGDEALRHARKEAVGRVEGALDEMENVIESRWRKWAGKERAESPVAVVTDAVPEPVDAAAVEQLVVEQLGQPERTLLADAPAGPASESVDVVEQTPSYPPIVDVSSESVDTLRPSSPVPSDVDTFLLPATSESDAQSVKKPSSSDEDVASDWSEVDA
ncbi:hypothetical protein FB45DRAFT_915698 [Roridomyces roridus]|uniref:BAG domain-containing protein n=1 Tax=Roridomyces roridus TaxID=1738132 RepID=A0AAD7FL66_9AGAR|nr:hypothetical protein FB45DRAFT_915698 [Roridomyces roridus]